MRTVEMRQTRAYASHPFTKPGLTTKAFVRCLEGKIAPGAPQKNGVYLVRDVIAVVNEERSLTNHLYKLDGFAGGVKSEKTFKSSLFRRWTPEVGDVVTRGTNMNPLVVSRVLDGMNERSDSLELHSFHADRRVWAYMDQSRDEDINPVLGVCLEPDVVMAIRNAVDVRVSVFQDDTFQAPVVQEVPADEDLKLTTKGDLNRTVRLKALRTDYRAALEKAIVSGDQFLAQMGEPLEGYREIRKIGELSSIVKPLPKR